MARTLALYRYQGCPFCTRVERVTKELGIDLELRDVLADRAHMRDLVAARSRRTVPVLRISDAEGGTDRWLGESGDIVAWLRAEYGDGGR